MLWLVGWKYDISESAICQYASTLAAALGLLGLSEGVRSNTSCVSQVLTLSKVAGVSMLNASYLLH